jgi:UPF0755 protein
MRSYLIGICVCFALCIGLIVYIFSLNRITTTFPVESPVRVEEGMSHTEIGVLLKDHQIIRSSLLFRMFLYTKHSTDFIQAGVYTFPEPLTTEQVADTLIAGTYRDPAISVTFPEGFKIADFYSLLPSGFSYAEKKDLTTYEGYLFPDTYFITQSSTIDTLVETMQQNFEEKMSPFKEEIDASGMTLNEVIILASIIEREAKDFESKRIVSGILQNRLTQGMPLQADATLDYILNKTSAELTQKDLKLDSPFNTYVYKGLPPAPIANPGIDAIRSVLEPEETAYLFYLTAPDGTFHYAKTFDEHKRNKERYLR